ncbi:hypothetical protein OQA88_8169 [Cercophora sp. LCS_1]
MDKESSHPLLLLPTTSSPQLPPLPNPNQKSKSPLHYLHHFLTLVLTLYLLTILLSSPSSTPDPYRPWTLPANLTTCSCLSNLECTYDALAAAWLPPHCRDTELADQFTKSGPNPDGTWTYYADANGTRRITEAEIAQLPRGGSFWVERDWHLMHCVFYWQKYMRMRITGTIMEERFDNIPHVRHCGVLLTKERPRERKLVEVEVLWESRATWRLGGEGHGHEHQHD